MKYYRHIGLTGSVTRLFLCFAAGCGFEAVFLEHRAKRVQRVTVVLLAGGLSVLAVGLFFLAANPAAAQRVIRAMHTQTATSLFADPAVFAVIFEPRILRNRLVLSGSFALLGGILLAARGLLSSNHARKILAAATLTLIASDVYVYKCGEVWLRTIPLPAQDMSLLAFQELPYRPRRSLSFSVPNPRVEALQRNFVFPGIRHLPTTSFAFVDEVGSSLRVDYWLVALVVRLS